MSQKRSGLLISAIALSAVPTHSKAQQLKTETPSKSKIASIVNFEKLSINNSTQWVLVRGKNSDGPLLIHVQMGPGAPMISEANEMENNLHLEDDFLVAYWDQRGCGLSYSKDLIPASINLNQMAEDIIACTKQLLVKYNKTKATLVGYSIGATVSLMAAAKNPSLFESLIAVGMDVDVPHANQFVLDFAMSKAIDKKDKKLIKQINELRQNPINDSKSFQKRAEILTNLGGIRTNTSFNSMVLGSLKNMLFSKYYRVGGLMKSINGLTLCQNALIPEMNGLDLFQTIKQVSIPVHFLQGNLDAVVPPQRCRQYYEQLEAPDKSFTLFGHSAHMPQYEEPEKFSSLIKSIAKNSNSSTVSK